MLRIAPASLLIVLVACEAENPEGVVSARPEAVVTDLVVSPSAALLTQTGQTRAFAASLPASMAGETVVWSSSNPAEVAVDANGNVTALSDVGAARIVALVGDQEAEALVVIAQPAANAELVADAQVVGEVVLADEDGLPPFTYRAQLTSVDVKVGEPIVATEGSRIAGTVTKVTEAADGTTIVDWESGPLAEVLDDFAFDLEFPIPAKAFVPTDLPDGWVASLDDGVISIERGGASAEKGPEGNPFCSATSSHLSVTVLGVTLQPDLSFALTGSAPSYSGASLALTVGASFQGTANADDSVLAEGRCFLGLGTATIDVGGVLGAQTQIGFTPGVEADFKFTASGGGLGLGFNADVLATGTYGWEDAGGAALEWRASDASEVRLKPVLTTPGGSYTLASTTVAGTTTSLDVRPALGSIPFLSLAKINSLSTLTSTIRDLPSQAASTSVRNAYAMADGTAIEGTTGAEAILAAEWGRALQAIPALSLPGTQLAGNPDGSLKLTLNPATKAWDGAVNTSWPPNVFGLADSLKAIRVYKQDPSSDFAAPQLTLVEELAVSGPGTSTFSYTPTQAELDAGIVFTANAVTDIGDGSEYELAPSTQAILDACPNNRVNAGGFEGDDAALWTWLYNGSAISSYLNQAMVLPRTGDKMATVGWEQDAEVLGSAMYQDIGTLAAGTYEVTYWTKVSAEAQQVAGCATRDNPRFEVGLGSFSSTPDTVEQYDGEVLYPADLLCSTALDQTGNYYTSADWQENTAILSLAEDAEHAFLAFQVYYGNWPRYWVFIDDVVLLPDGETCD
ncbi:hypothetical protein LBMAG42_50340 [Deltaproteobacteria bacterium]|nr:hypothetical protein LBMAG42_50340 [Deltaproteobacteria bacterium]